MQDPDEAPLRVGSDGVSNGSATPPTATGGPTTAAAPTGSTRRRSGPRAVRRRRPRLPRARPPPATTSSLPTTPSRPTGPSSTRRPRRPPTPPAGGGSRALADPAAGGERPRPDPARPGPTRRSIASGSPAVRRRGSGAAARLRSGRGAVAPLRARSSGDIRRSRSGRRTTRDRFRPDTDAVRDDVPSHYRVGAAPPVVRAPRGRGVTADAPTRRSSRPSDHSLPARPDPPRAGSRARARGDRSTPRPRRHPAAGPAGPTATSPTPAP